MRSDLEKFFTDGLWFPGIQECQEQITLFGGIGWNPDFTVGRILIQKKSNLKEPSLRLIHQAFLLRMACTGQLSTQRPQCRQWC